MKIRKLLKGPFTWFKLKLIAKHLERYLPLYERLAKDPRVPKKAKVLLGGAIGYWLLPIDIIPDFIPVIGQIDDILLVPLAIYIAFKLIDPKLIEEHKKFLNMPLD